jgi:hypothetical protein
VRTAAEYLARGGDGIVDGEPNKRQCGCARVLAQPAPGELQGVIALDDEAAAADAQLAAAGEHAEDLEVGDRDVNELVVGPQRGEKTTGAQEFRVWAKEVRVGVSEVRVWWVKGAAGAGAPGGRVGGATDRTPYKRGGTPPPTRRTPPAE